MSPHVPFLDVIIGLAATFLGLSIAVQIVQEAYKFLTSSKGRAYKSSLLDALGPFAKQLLKIEAFPDFVIRGPFQLTRLSPQGFTLPLGKEEIAQGLERVLPSITKYTLDIIKQEVKYQSDVSQKASPAYSIFLEELSKVEKGAMEYFQTQHIAEFLIEWGHKTDKKKKNEFTIGKITPPASFSAVQMLDAYRMRFLPHIDEAAGKVDRLNMNFEYSYKRRNMRQTFVIAFLITLFFNFSFDSIYNRVNSLSSNQIYELASQTLEIYNKLGSKGNLDSIPDTAKKSDSIVFSKDSTNQARLFNEHLKLLQLQLKILKSNSEQASLVSNANYIIDWEFLKKIYELGILETLKYFLSCLITTFFVSFGAPFWNDLLNGLVRMGKGAITSKNDKTEVKNG